MTFKLLYKREFSSWHGRCFNRQTITKPGGKKMNATTNEARLTGITKRVEIESTESTRYAQNSLLSELPGLVFGVITFGYIVSSLIALA